MAEGEGSNGPDDAEIEHTHSGHPPRHAEPTNDEGENEEEDEEEEEGEEEEEPRLKYANITKHLGPLHRNGDASSAFLVSGDKMIVATHNGNIHVLSLPAFRLLKYYRGHSASVTSISMSPFPPPIGTSRLDGTQRVAAEASEQARSPASSPAAKNSPRPGPVPNTLSNQIYIATSSIDGNICVQSLVDPKDVQLRNFGRPILAVALSPDYRSDRNYLSGGQAGSLVLTNGGQTGRSTNATTTGTAAAASGWLGSIGLGADVGSDKVLHSGEGAISTIQWSLSGKYVLWVNEEGIKIMRSNLKLEGAESTHEWKRLGHIDKPNRPGWDEMAGVWKARVQWIDRDNLELDNEEEAVKSTPANGAALDIVKQKQHKLAEEVIVGWGDTTWLIKVRPSAAGKNGDENMGKVDIITTVMHFNDCTISGISQYTPKLVLVLAYMERKGDPKDSKSGRRNRQNALEPELRLVDIDSREEVDADTLTINRFETLSASDYHLTILPPFKIPTMMSQRGYLSAIGSGVGTIGSGIYSGVETVGQGAWNATMYPTRMIGANRLFSGTDSIRSDKSDGEKPESTKGSNYLTSWIPTFGFGRDNEALNDVGAAQGSKIFICSPYDCVVAVKRTLADRLQWLVNMERFEDAWNLLDQHPEIVVSASELSETSSPPTPSKASSVARSGSAISPAPAQNRQQATLADFFAESSSVASPSKAKDRNSSAEKEKRRIGEMWLKELTGQNKWSEAGEVAAKVLNTTTSWEHWAWLFIQNKKVDEITPSIPTYQITPPLPSVIFEIVLGHYVSVNRPRFKDLLDQWPSDLFEIANVSNAVEDQLQSEDTATGSTEWRMLQECLAKLYLADGRYKDALRCYILLQDAETALTLVKEHHLVDTIADDIPSFVLLRISPEQRKSASQEDLGELSSEPIKLLVDEASTGVVLPDQVVSQLHNTSNTLFVFFYLRALWRGEGLKQTPTAPRVGHSAAVSSLAADEGKTFVDDFADTAVDLFAEYDRNLLMDFLQTSTSYTFEKAVAICERRHYLEELVYLLSNTGQLRKALFLIIDDLKDVSKAITFAKEQDDKGLWEDLLEYSMSRPKFIEGLLAEAGTAINPIELVKRIPNGLEVDGLRQALLKLIREFDLQDSISSGAAKIFYSEVSVGLQELRKGRRRGIKFDIVKAARHRPISQDQQPTSASGVAESDAKAVVSGHCAACGRLFVPDETDTLVGFACGHVFHVSHLPRPGRDEAGEDNEEPEGERRRPELDDEVTLSTFTRTVGPKVTHARLLKDRIEVLGGCRVCRMQKGEGNQGGPG